MTRTSLCILAAVLTAGCVTTVPAPGPVTSVPSPTAPARSAVINLAPASGSLASGRITAMPMGNGVHFTGEIGGLTRRGTHAIHIHEKGDCSVADASSAGAHFNPRNRPHGRPGAASHAGDLPNIVADANGVARLELHVDGVTLGGAAASDVAGRALVVHAQADDYTSQPAGNSGARIACGIIAAIR